MARRTPRYPQEDGGKLLLPLKMFPEAINTLSAFALIGEGKKKKKKITPSKPTAAKKHQARGVCALAMLRSAGKTNTNKPIFPTYSKSRESRGGWGVGGVPLWREHAQRQTLNLGLKGTPAALLGLACSVGAAEQRFHQPGGSPLLVESNPVPQYWVCRDVLRVW